MVGSLKGKVAKGSLWVLLEQFSVQGLNLGMGIVLARLLTPNDYGTVALVTIFISIAMVLVNSGLGQALVQKKDADELDFNSVFYVSFAVACGLYLVLFALAPFVAAYYKTPELKAILRVLALNLPLYAVNSVQSAELFSKMRFDLSFRISLVTALASACVGIGLALCRWGVWALVWSSVLASLAGTVARWCFIAWRPKRMFSLHRVVPLFRFGWKVMVSALLYALSSNLYGILIGKFHAKADLAFVNKGRNIPDLLKNNIQTSLVESAFPAVSQLKDDDDRYKNALQRLLIVSTFTVLPVMLFVAQTSSKTVLLLYGAKWLACVPYAQLTCLSACLMTLSSVNELGLLARGRSDLFLRLNVIRILVSLLILIVVLPRGVLTWMRVSTFVYAPFATLLVMCVARRVCGLKLGRQFRDVLPSVMLTACAGGALALGDRISVVTSPVALFICLVCQGVGFAVVYLGLAFLFRIRALREVATIALPKLSARFPFCRRLAVYLSVDMEGSAR